MAGAAALRHLVLALVPGLAESGPGAQRAGAAALAQGGRGGRGGCQGQTLGRPWGGEKGWNLLFLVEICEIHRTFWMAEFT